MKVPSLVHPFSCNITYLFEVVRVRVCVCVRERERERERESHENPSKKKNIPLQKSKRQAVLFGA